MLRYSSYATLNGLETPEDRPGATPLGKYSDFRNAGPSERSSSLAQMFQRVIMQSVECRDAGLRRCRGRCRPAEPYGRAVGMVRPGATFTWMLIYADTIVHVMPATPGRWPCRL